MSNKPNQKWLDILRGFDPKRWGAQGYDVALSEQKRTMRSLRNAGLVTTKYVYPQKFDYGYYSIYDSIEFLVWKPTAKGRKYLAEHGGGDECR